MPHHAGPVIDAHHHLWDLRTGHYPWLTRPDAAIGALGDTAYLRRSHLPDELAAAMAGQGVVATVHVEAVWDPARSPVEETAWLEALPKPPGMAAACVAAAPLDHPDVAELLAAQAAFGRVRGVRETIRWHPDPAKRWTRAGRVDEPAWRHGLSLLPRHDLLLELLLNPHQMREVAALAEQTPGQVFVVNHCGTPNDRDPEGLARWRDGLRRMGARDNVWIKLSNFAAYAPDRSLAADRDTLRTCIDAFGPARCLFGSDWPVSRRTMPYDAMLARFREVVSEYTIGEQTLMLHDAAARLYRIDFPGPTLHERLARGAGARAARLRRHQRPRGAAARQVLPAVRARRQA